MREKDSEFMNCRALIFVAVAFFCTIVGVAKTTNGGVSGKVLYANDSLLLRCQIIQMTLFMYLIRI